MRRPSVLALILVIALPLHAQSLGETTFPNSGSPEAQEPFLRGLLLLHSFEYADARAAFQEARATDPDFAMAAWGEALTHNHPIWQEQDREAALAALNGVVSEGLTEREQAYLGTLDVLYGEGDKEDRDDAFAVAMGELATAYPDDLDASAFHALAILGTAHEGRDFSTYMRAAAVAEEVFDRNPRHPGAAHYLIHAYDDPVHAPLGLRPARVYAEIAPSASHALHMPSHIYVALGLWDEAAAMNVRSFDAAQARDERNGEPVGGHGWHALQWRVYAELQRGRFDEAQRLLDLAQSLYDASSTRRALYGLVSARASVVVETEDWDGEAAIRTLQMEEAWPALRIREAFVHGFAALRRGDRDQAEFAFEAIQADLDSLERGEPALQASALQLEGLLLLDSGETDEGLARLEEATAVEDAMPLDFGPPNPVKPTHELLGEALLDLGRANEAIIEFEKALARAPRRMRSLHGLAQAAEAVGDDETARYARSELRALLHAADQPIRDDIGAVQVAR
ncbi:MAG: hypothetical protein HKN04_04260 [Rhodothermaceae bacterium]|nr:hypothetical protein [Rhodothermaceae bacterium]